MKDTPRTNDIIEQVKGFRTSSAIYSLEQFSRELERELTAAREELKAVTEQRDRLADALRKAKPIVSRYPSGLDFSHDELDVADEEIDEALQSLTKDETHWVESHGTPDGGGC